MSKTIVLDPNGVLFMRRLAIIRGLRDEILSDRGEGLRLTRFNTMGIARTEFNTPKRTKVGVLKDAVKEMKRLYPSYSPDERTMKATVKPAK